MAPPEVLSWSLAAALALGVLGGAWWTRFSGRRRDERADQARSRALVRKASALRRVEERYRDFFEHSPLGIFRSSPAGRFLDANGNLARMLGFATSEELMEAVTDIGVQLYLDPWERAEAFRRVLGDGIIKDFEVRLRRRDGATVWLSLNLRAVCDETGVLDHVEGFAVNVTGRRRAEEALAASEREHRQILLWMRDILYRLDPEGRIVFVNHAVTRYGYAVEGLLGRDVLELVPSRDRPRLRRSMAERRTGERRTSGVEFLLRPGPGWDRQAAPPVMLLEAEGIYETDAEGELVFLGSIGVARDITRLTLAEERLTRSLEGKELLLQELRHRVKNNLQVLQSLVALTGNRVTTPEAGRACREISGYIRCLAVMHALLSRVPTGDRVNLADMVRDLFAAVSGLYPARGAAAHFELEDVSLHLDKALPCGMLFNTLVADVFKHSLPEVRPGRMRVALARLPDGRVRIEMADSGAGHVWKDGIGGADMDAGLIRSLAAQLEAELDLDCGAGTRFRLVFEPAASRDRLRGGEAPAAREDTQSRPM